MELPELPEPFRWAWTDESGACIKQEDTDVAWYWKPGHGVKIEDAFECVSAPVGTDRSREYLRVVAETEEEAINMIVSFALLGITKEN